MPLYNITFQQDLTQTPQLTSRGILGQLRVAFNITTENANEITAPETVLEVLQFPSPSFCVHLGSNVLDECIPNLRCLKRTLPFISDSFVHIALLVHFLMIWWLAIEQKRVFVLTKIL